MPLGMKRKTSKYFALKHPRPPVIKLSERSSPCKQKMSFGFGAKGHISKLLPPPKRRHIVFGADPVDVGVSIGVGVGIGVVLSCV